MTSLRASSQFKKLLVIDDEPSVLLALKLLLEALGFSVTDMPTPTEALAHLAAKKDYDVILCDLRMPEMDGITVLREAKRIAPTIPFVLISGHAQTEEVETAMKYKVDGFLDKPFTPDQLGDVFNKLAGKKTVG